MGCGESKHAVTTQNSMTRSQSKSRSFRNNPKDGENVSSDGAAEPVIIREEEKKGNEQKDQGIETGKLDANDAVVVSEKPMKTEEIVIPENSVVVPEKPIKTEEIIVIPEKNEDKGLQQEREKIISNEEIIEQSPPSTPETETGDKAEEKVDADATEANSNEETIIAQSSPLINEAQTGEKTEEEVEDTDATEAISNEEKIADEEIIEEPSLLINEPQTTEKAEANVDADSIVPNPNEQKQEATETEPSNEDEDLAGIEEEEKPKPMDFNQ